MSLLACVGIAILTLGLWFGARHSGQRAERLWAAAWCSPLASGALVLFVATPCAAVFIAFLGPIFPAGQLAGALAYTRGRAPGWIVPAALGLGLLRAASLVWGFEGRVDWVPIAVEPAGTLAAAWLLHRAARLPGVPWTLAVLPLLLVVAAVCDLATAMSAVFATGLPISLAVLWSALVIVGMPLQVYVAVNRDRHQLTNLQYRTEAELEQSQARFRALSESAFDLVAELDGDERFTYVNPRYEEVLGYPRAEMLGRSPLDFLHPEDVEAGRRFADAADTADVGGEIVLRARRSDGTWIWLENVARSYVAPDGRRRWVMNSRDVSERMLREEMRERDHARLAQTAAETGDRFRVLTEQAPQLIAEFDEHGRYTFANAAFRELLGLDPKTLIGSTPEHLVHPDDVAASRACMVEALRSEGHAHAVHRLRHVDGSWRWFEQTGRAYRSASGALRIVSIGHDVTEARRQEEERRAFEHRMREVQRLDSLGALTGGIAHDFNNLLAVILGNVKLLEDAGLGFAAQRRLRRIHAAAAHAGALTDQMLTYAGRSVTELAPLDLSHLVTATGDLLRATVADRGRLELDLELADAPLVVRGDATQLRQVLLNLVANAAEAVAGSGRGGRVSVRTGRLELADSDLADGFGAAERPPGAWVVLEVTDDGPGMSAALCTRIFEPFFTTRATGRGLGLSAVLGIAGAHGGVLQVDSAPGLGTTFRLLLRPSHESPPPAPPGGGPGPAVRGREARILVVDDDEAVREVTQMLLERAGYRALAAAGGEQALALLAGGAGIDAVMLDLEMPSPSGAELVERIRQVRPDLPIVIASGYRRELAAERLDRDETFGFVQKPFDPDALLAAIDDALRAPPRPPAMTPPIQPAAS